MKIIGIDPGEHYNGYAGIEILPDRSLEVTVVPTTLSKKLLYERLSALTKSTCHTIVAEDWLTRPNVARPGGFDFDRMGTARILGAIELLSEQLEIPLVLQPPAIKPIGYGYMNMKYQKGAKMVHQWDALCHAVYYAVARQKALPLGEHTPKPGKNLKSD